MIKEFPKVVFIHVDSDYKSIFVEYQNGYKITVDNNLINEPFKKEKLEVRNYKYKKNVINYFNRLKELIPDNTINSAIQSINNFKK